MEGYPMASQGSEVLPVAQRGLPALRSSRKTFFFFFELIDTVSSSFWRPMAKLLSGDDLKIDGFVKSSRCKARKN